MKPVTDGRVLTDRPQELLRLFKFNRTIQYMTGTVRDEFGTAGLRPPDGDGGGVVEEQ